MFLLFFENESQIINLKSQIINHKSKISFNELLVSLKIKYNFVAQKISYEIDREYEMALCHKII